LSRCAAATKCFSITVKLNPALRKAIAAIAEADWQPIPYWIDGAETSYRPFGNKETAVRLIVRRVKPTPGSQLALLTVWDHHAFITNRRRHHLLGDRPSPPRRD
jgi:hypothetical protein